ncbi:major capsid protein [Rhizobium rhizogenes]|uniref:major capsid protein n=1 Tax=Rhizobium rhizogenes TaxID=359 RepID=UPI001574D3E4|nr:major capsid protein [Rhizobium rhizogenes]NTI27126.1 hypothetical protein [Rhizobium rhizogenes]
MVAFLAGFNRSQRLVTGRTSMAELDTKTIKRLRKAVADDEAIVVPLGTPFFKRYIAPPDTISGANRRPDPDTKVFVSTDDLPHDKGREIHTESNVLPICIRPQLLIRLKMK